jgi:Tfp pilus assembly protein PilF
MDLAVERAPQDLETRLAVAQWALEAGLMDLAKANAQAAFEVDPSSLPARIAVGVVARNEKDNARALELFTSAHLQSPGNFAAMNHLALTLIQQSDPGERRRALEFAQVNARLYGDLRLAAGREATVTLAWVLFKLGRDAEAFQHLSAAGQAGSITPESTYYAASILVSRGNPDAARKLLEGCLRQEHIFPHREDAQALLETLRTPP